MASAQKWQSCERKHYASCFTKGTITSFHHSVLLWSVRRREVVRDRFFDQKFFKRLVFKLRPVVSSDLPNRLSEQQLDLLDENVLVTSYTFNFRWTTKIGVQKLKRLNDLHVDDSGVTLSALFSECERRLCQSQLSSLAALVSKQIDGFPRIGFMFRGNISPFLFYFRTTVFIVFSIISEPSSSNDTSTRSPPPVAKH
ncbi:hypothetical protein L1887_23888 [Cichorium endivia]|nr:hypothetical protein L1887_23888 [Cichorium endivia]